MSKQRQKGTVYENYLRDQYLRRLWKNADRAPQRGVNDAGDFDGVGPFIIEAKKHNAWRIPHWIRTTAAKGRFEGKPWMIVFAGDKRDPLLSEDYVVLPAKVLFGLMGEAVEAHSDDELIDLAGGWT